MISREDATRLLLEHVTPLLGEKLDIPEVPGRVAAESVVAEADLPPTCISRVDGYCVRSRDTTGASASRPVSLLVASRVFPEDAPAPLPAGACAIVVTGSPLPPGADACVPQEETQASEGSILLAAPVAPGERVAAPGSEIPRGTQLLRAGGRVRPCQVGLLASAGRRSLLCHRVPAVTLVGTGSELGLPPGPGGLAPASNLYMLHAFLTSMGARPVTRGVLPDDPGMIARALAEAGGDLIVTTGGTGPGSRDVLAQGLSMAGAGALFRGVLMKPGRHTSAFLLGGRLVLGLSGPPTAALAGFQALVKPVVLRLMGLYDVNPPGNKARLDGEVRPSSLETLLPVTLHGSGPWARPAGPGECPEALLVVPRGAEGRHGEVFPVLLLD